MQINIFFIISCCLPNFFINKDVFFKSYREIVDFQSSKQQVVSIKTASRRTHPSVPSKQGMTTSRQRHREIGELWSVDRGLYSSKQQVVSSKTASRRSIIISLVHYYIASLLHRYIKTTASFSCIAKRLRAAERQTK